MDDWSLLPSRNAVSEPAPDPQSPMTTTTLPRCQTRPPASSAHSPVPITRARNARRLTRTSSSRQMHNQSGAKPQNPDQSRRSMPHRNQSATPKVKDLEPRLDIARPFMDDTGRPRKHASSRERPAQVQRRQKRRRHAAAIATRRAIARCVARAWKLADAKIFHDARWIDQVD